MSSYTEDKKSIKAQSQEEEMMLWRHIIVDCENIIAERKKEEERKRKSEEQLKKDFTEEERKTFDEYYSLERKWIDGEKNDETARPEAKDKVYAYVEQMLLIPGSIDRCKEYLERKLLTLWHIEEGKKAYRTCWIDETVFNIEKAKELSVFTEEEKKTFDEFYSLERKWLSYDLRDQHLKEAHKKVKAYVESMLLIPGSIDRCKEHLERKLRTWRSKEFGGYIGLLNGIVSSIEKDKELRRTFTEEEIKMFDEYHELEFTYMSLRYKGEDDRLQAQEAYDKTTAFVRERLNGSLVRCWEYITKKHHTR